MELNLTDSEERLFLIATSSVYAVLFLIALFPLVLTLLCTAATLLAQSLSLKIRVLLVNIFSAELCIWVSVSILYLGYPGRYLSRSSDDTSCRLVISLFVISALQKYSSVALYAITVYYFVRGRTNLLRWCLIVTYIACSWIVAVALGILPFFDVFSSYDADVAFCDGVQTRLTFMPFALVTLGALLFVCVIIIFSALTFHHYRKNLPRDNPVLKRSITRTLLYFLVASLVSLTNLVLPAVIPFVKGALSHEPLARLILFAYVFRVLLTVVSMVTPVATIVILMPLRVALKQLLRKIFCWCFKQRNERDDEDQHEVETTTALD